MRPHNQERYRKTGFTLLELAIVILLIGVIAGIALPNVIPAIAFGELEGAARHLSNYGRTVLAEAALMREKITVRFDLDEQVYYAVHWVVPDTEDMEGELEPDQLSLLKEYRAGSGLSQQDFGDLLAGSREEGIFSDFPSEFDDDMANRQLMDKFNKFALAGTKQRAENVIPEEGILDEIGPLFEEDEEFKLEEAEPEEVEYTASLLQRCALPTDVRIESIELDGEPGTSGIIEVELSALGLDSEAVFYVSNSDGEYYTVIWDPIIGGTNIYAGKEDFS